MDNNSMPPIQPMQPTMPTQAPQMATAPNGMPMVQQVQVNPAAKKDVVGLVKTIVIILVSLIAVTFIGLFIWMAMQFNEANSDLQGKIDIAVAEAKDEQTTKMEAEFLEREKYPYKTFSGPADYGQLTFEYPRTWSVYVANAAIDGGDFRAYFNPNQVDPVARDTIFALDVSIVNKSFEDVSASYQKYVEDEKVNFSVQTIEVGGTTGNRYTGVIPGTELNGFIVIFKIRDKTAILQSDSVLFENDFNKLLETVTFNA